MQLNITFKNTEDQPNSLIVVDGQKVQIETSNLSIQEGFDFVKQTQDMIKDFRSLFEGAESGVHFAMQGANVVLKKTEDETIDSTLAPATSSEQAIIITAFKRFLEPVKDLLGDDFTIEPSKIPHIYVADVPLVSRPGYKVGFRFVPAGSDQGFEIKNPNYKRLGRDKNNNRYYILVDSQRVDDFYEKFKANQHQSFQEAKQEGENY